MRMTARLASSRGSKRAIEITDLSTDGFSTATSVGQLDNRTGYAVKFGGLETLGAELRWTGEDEAGFRFARPLHPAVLSHVVRGNPPPAEDSGSDAELEDARPNDRISND